jgi:hypothetical protein
MVLVPCEWLGESERGGCCQGKQKGDRSASATNKNVAHRLQNVKLTDASGGWAALLRHGSHLLMIRPEYQAVTHAELVIEATLQFSCRFMRDGRALC